jgi:hypothetical protein
MRIETGRLRTCPGLLKRARHQISATVRTLVGIARQYLAQVGGFSQINARP